MTLPQEIYLAALAIYTILFLMFARFFWWKHEAERLYWHRRPKLDLEDLKRQATAQGRELPFISILVPAREEADVIARTIDHMRTLTYPSDRYELLVVTDEKELRARDRQKPGVVQKTRRLLTAGIKRQLHSQGIPSPVWWQANAGSASAAAPVSLMPMSPLPGSQIQPTWLAAPVAAVAASQASPRRAWPVGSFYAASAAVAAEEPAPVPAVRRLLTLVRPGLQSVPEDVRTLAVGVLAHLALADLPNTLGALDDTLPWGELFAVPPAIRENTLREVSLGIIKHNGRVTPQRLVRIVRQEHLDITPEQAQRLYPLYVSLALPVVGGYYLLTEEQSAQTLTTVMTRTARAFDPLTRHILQAMTDNMLQRLVDRLQGLVSRRKLVTLLQELYERCFPTTQDVVEFMREQWRLRPGMPVLRHVMVPPNFDGAYPGELVDHEVPSTKGRALNYGLSFIDPRAELLAFYDAESRPDRNVLMYVAWRRLRDGQKANLFQGPVFQLRNFYDMSAFCKVASLYQAVTHDWYLPSLFKRIPFVGGTNLVIDRDLLLSIGGYDHKILTEDLELGTRAYLAAGAWPEYLPYPSSEQTPPTIKGFFRQRLRWGSGHLQVTDKIRGDKTLPADRRRYLLRQLVLKGQFEWVLYQLATFIPPTILILYAEGLVDTSIVPAYVGWILNVWSLVYFSFTFYIFFRYRPYIDASGRPSTLWGRVLVAAQLLVLPLAAFLFPVPYTTALYRYKTGRAPSVWVKTPRTKE